jgi:hypothetical protein
MIAWDVGGSFHTICSSIGSGGWRDMAASIGGLPPGY